MSPLRHKWRAHMHSCTDMKFIQHAQILITASVDQSVRVWSGKDGAFIGTFGGSAWSLTIKGA
jgi:WD40 repeat protein